MISKNKIEEAIKSCKDVGYDISIKDVSFFFLKREYQDESLAYEAIFGEVSEKALKEYMDKEGVKFLVSYMNSNFRTKKKPDKKTVDFSDISFEENKDALIQKLSEIKEAQENGDLDIKDALKLEVDIRTKLNDKFNVAEQSEKEYVIVEPKFNHICELTRKECWLQTKEFAMKHWNLVEKDKQE